MSWTPLKDNYTNASWSGLKKYEEIDNGDGTKSFVDKTEYENREDSFFGAKDANAMNAAINLIMANLENGTDLYTEFLEYFNTQKELFQSSADATKADFTTYTDGIKADYKTDIETFEHDQELVFKTWFDYIKEQLGSDVAGNLQLQIENLKNKVEEGIGYQLTSADKSEIAEMIDGATIVQAPKYVNSVDEMVDTDRVYVLASTGTIWAYLDSTTEQEVTVTDKIVGTTDNPYIAGRFGSDGSINTDAAKTHVVTPYIDLSKYNGKTIELHLDGNRYVSESVESFIYHQILDDNKTIIFSRNPSVLASNYLFSLNGLTGVINDTTSATLTLTPPMTYASGKIPFRYIRFCGLGSESTSNVYITYTEHQPLKAWVDTGVTFGGGGSVDPETLAKISELNNEGADPTTIKLLPQPVLDFYNTSDYSDSDYTTSHLSKITYPCRADIPVPFLVKWSHNENAMRTTLVVDTKAIGTVNAYRMRIYDVTGFDSYPIYNLLPNTTYYYKVTHVMADGSLVDAKSGSFLTSSEPWRLLYIEGTQNVRDLGGWTGLNGKKVKYGKIFRGAALSDSSGNNLIVTGKGRLSLAELKIQAELNLGAIDNETSIASNCAYKKLYYTNYAIAITEETYRAQFKTVLEWIIEQLTASKPIYMHCQGGCDRTGTLSFQLLGLLGVSESDLAKEYELSSFSDVGFGRLRTTTKAVDTYDYVGMVQALKTYSGNTITDKFYDFATTGCGISADTIAEFRNLMLG